ncbi:glycosyltransferase family 2 protein [Pedobacter sp.]|uniref:glycosyltransferase family 2 protein n=1 Tax=Pedobacter sp. TaxID=1411316 RepID=UPI003D7FD497
MLSLKKLFSIFDKKDIPVSDQKYYFSICCIVKDENDYIAEWIDYHQKVGVEHFYIYDNGSKNPIRETIASLNYGHVATVIEFPGKTKQVPAYRHCLKHFGRTSQWIAFIDMDEFIFPKTEDSDLRKFMQKYEPYGGLGVSWLIFGSNGHVKKPAGRQLENFTMRSETSFIANTHIKSIVQPRFVKSESNAHSFKYLKNYDCVNEHFEATEGWYSPNSVDTIQLNHYYCRSLEEYHQKVTRGNCDTKRARKLEAFYTHNQESNAVEDTEILKVYKKALEYV